MPSSKNTPKVCSWRKDVFRWINSRGTRCFLIALISRNAQALNILRVHFISKLKGSMIKPKVLMPFFPAVRVARCINSRVESYVRVAGDFSLLGALVD